MTNQEAIEKFEKIKRGNIFLIHQRIEGKEVFDDYSLCDMAISALQEQELSNNSPKLDSGNGELATTCNDTISRQAAIDILDAYQVMVENGEENPYAWARLRMSELPPAQPERETAKFIRWMECKKTANYISYTPHCKCSKCGTEFLIETIKYCYMCGARMER